MNSISPEEQQRLRQRRRGILWTAGLLALVAVGVYIAFIVMVGLR